MPLINCPDCGKEVSDQAPTCPNCGRPIKNEEKTEEEIYREVKGAGQSSGSNEGCFLQTLNVGCMIIFGFIAVVVVIVILGALAG